MMAETRKNALKCPPTARSARQRAACRGSPTVGTSRRKTWLSKSGCQTLLVVPPDELDAGQLAVADLADERRLVVAPDLAVVRSLEADARLDVVQARASGRGRSPPRSREGRGRGRAAPRRASPRGSGRRERRAATRARPSSRSGSAGSFCRHRETIASRASGASGRRRRSGSASRSITAARTWAGVSRRKTGCPVAISLRMSPTANWSARASTGRPLACSGDMYSSVPRSMPARVPCRVSVSRASTSPRGGGRQLGEAEVEDLQQALGSDHQVLRLEVAVEDARRGAPSPGRPSAARRGRGAPGWAAGPARGGAGASRPRRTPSPRSARPPRRRRHPRRRSGRCSGG